MKTVEKMKVFERGAGGNHSLRHGCGVALSPERRKGARRGWVKRWEVMCMGYAHAGASTTREMPLLQIMIACSRAHPNTC